nr:reverse transcriptase domain-containing protein [Tanacetum cinerariifolium]
MPKGNGCFECGAPGHFKRDCLNLKNKDGGNVNAQEWVYAVENAKKKGNASRNLDSNVATGWMYDVGNAERNGNAARNPDSNVYGLVEETSCRIVCDEKLVRVPFGNETLVFRGAESYIERESRLTVISCSKVQEYRAKGCRVFLAHISATKEEIMLLPA